MIEIFNTWFEPKTLAESQYRTILVKLDFSVPLVSIDVRVNDFTENRHEFLKSPHYEIQIKKNMYDFGGQKMFRFNWIITTNGFGDAFVLPLIIKEMEQEFSQRLNEAYEKSTDITTDAPQTTKL